MDLSIVIPSRNEMFLKNTVEDALKQREADTEIIALLDGAWANPPIEKNERVHVIYVNKSVGQRAGANLAVDLARGKYIMKIDAHCSFDKGFDSKMLKAFKETGDDVIMVPVMRNLWAFDWKCTKCGKRWYQGPTPTECKEQDYQGTGIPCDGKEFVRKIKWKGKERPQSTSYCFDSTPHFQYFRHYDRREDVKEQIKSTGITETMCLQGSCFMLTKDLYKKLNVCDESLGNWGNQGIEVACKAWLSGRKVLVNRRTWYAHMFRTQGGDFGFPWQASGRDMKRTKDNVKDLLWDMKWPLQTYPVSWLVQRFWPVPGWTEDDLKRLKEHEKSIAGQKS